MSNKAPRPLDILSQSLGKNILIRLRGYKEVSEFKSFKKELAPSTKRSSSKKVKIIPSKYDYILDEL